MKLISKEIERRLRRYPIYSQNGKGEEAIVIVKFFNPYGPGICLVTEGEKREDGDWLFFGCVQLLDGFEWGYFKLSELSGLGMNVFGYQLMVERDQYFKPKKLCEVREYQIR